MTFDDWLASKAWGGLVPQHQRDLMREVYEAGQDDAHGPPTPNAKAIRILESDRFCTLTRFLSNETDPRKDPPRYQALVAWSGFRTRESGARIRQVAMRMAPTGIGALLLAHEEGQRLLAEHVAGEHGDE